MNEEQRWVLTVACPSASGQVAAISGFLDGHGCYINEFSCFDDDLGDTFFVRAVFRPGSDTRDIPPSLREDFAPLAARFGMTWAMHALSDRPKVLIMVSKLDHCLRDLLYRWRIGGLPVEIVGVVSNHLTYQKVVVNHDLPFHHIKVTKENKPEAEARLLALVEETGAEFVVLARYMQVLSPELCRRLDGWAINIHHSLLPGFKGAKPYHQAYNKGVKMVGATAHYINNDLDEGPIIAQGVEVVDHSHYPEDLIAKGRDIECLTLARAVGYHIERRVFLNANRTVVL